MTYYVLSYESLKVKDQKDDDNIVIWEKNVLSLKFLER